MISELLRRRVPQIVVAYIVAGWGLVQFVGFLEERYALAPSWVDLVGLSVLLFVPTMLIVGWTHGAPGPDHFNRRQLTGILTNAILAIGLLVGVFGGRDFSSVFETVTVANEDGSTSDVSVPRANFRISLADFAFELSAAHMEDEWVRAGLAYLLELDLSQDPFLEMRSFLEHAEAARRAGVENLSRIPHPLQRKIAADTHARFFLRGTLDRVENDYVAHYRILETGSGREQASGEVRSPDLFTLADLLSVEVRRGVGVSASSFSRSPDQPTADLSTNSLAALKGFVLAVEKMMWENDFESAHAFLEKAVAEDPSFAIGQFNLFATSSNLNRKEEADAAMEAAMQHAYRLPERLQNLIKANYYFNKEDQNRGLAVLERWATVMPDDLLPKQLLAFQYRVRGRVDEASQMYEDLLALNPSNGETWRQLGALYQDGGHFDRALECYEHYTELYPESASGFVSLASCQELAGQLDVARVTLDRAALLDPNNLSIQTSLADLHAKSGEFEEAEGLYTETLDRARTASERASVLDRQRSYYTARAQHSHAIETFHEWAEQARQVYPPAQFNIVLAMGYSLYGEAGRFEEGLAELDKIAAEVGAPLDRFVTFGRCRILLAAGRLTEAREAIDAMQQTADDFGIGSLQRVITAARAELADLEGNHSDAVKLWEESIGDGRARIHQYIGLAASERAVGESKKAEAALAEGLRLYPSHGRLNYRMALVQLDRERNAKAREYLERSLASWEFADESDADVRAAREWAVSLSQR